MSFGEGDLHARVDELERERDYWKAECRDMLSEFHRDAWGEHCAMLDYPRPDSECAPSIMVMACRQGYEMRIEEDGRRIAELESLARDMHASLWTVSEPRAYDLYRDRMAALGLLEGDES